MWGEDKVDARFLDIIRPNTQARTCMSVQYAQAAQRPRGCMNPPDVVVLSLTLTHIHSLTY